MNRSRIGLMAETVLLCIANKFGIGILNWMLYFTTEIDRLIEVM